METRSRSLFRVLGILLAWVFMVGINALANILLFGGVNTGEMSARYPSMFTPAGFTFAIWSVIYLGLLLYVLVQALPRFRSDPAVQRADGWFGLNAVLNAAWIVAWHYGWLWLTMLLMLALLWTLVRMYAIFQDAPRGSALFAAAFRIPISIYLAWICMATLANLSILQSAWGWNEALISAEAWTLGKLLVAVAVGSFVYRRYRDAAFVAVLVWAAYGIASNQADGSLVGMVAAGISLVGVATILLQGAARLKNQSQTT